MKDVFKAVKVGERVHWVGAIDWSVRDFHGYHTKRGSTYNAYLITGDEPILVDTVKKPFKHELLSRISSVMDPKDIAYIISDHSEPDHTGCLSRVIKMVKPKKVYASAMGVKTLGNEYNLGDVIAVKDGETIKLGNNSFTFLETRMLHWPDSMMSFHHEDGVLFSQDGFGMHLASGERFTDEIDEGILMLEAAKYYANILLPYSNIIPGIIKKITDAGFDIKTIGPDHGPVWRKPPFKIIDLYKKWAAQKPELKALVVYDTMWGSTDHMAKAVTEGLIAQRIDVKLIRMTASHRTEVATEVLDAGALILGSPTLNNGIFPTLADSITYVKGLRPKNLIGATFGSYGWSGESVGILENMLKEMDVEIVGEGVKAHYSPTDDDIAACYALGETVGKKLHEICGK